ncbi:hypothetical protein VTN77DRAFT_8263 [Rasamsonia byssochlamydoides]|uniref:uncharacterized protein n=1 Tax=Rasamsonia byssochlamydoides TaxID=89139 RepID=UPI003743BE9B
MEDRQPTGWHEGRGRPWQSRRASENNLKHVSRVMGPLVGLDDLQSYEENRPLGLLRGDAPHDVIARSAANTARSGADDQNCVRKD